MSDNKCSQNDPERTLITLEQLSQTIEVMTSVVNRLRKHLSEQLKAQIAERDKMVASANTVRENNPLAADQTLDNSLKPESGKESFVVEVTQQETEPVKKNSKILH